MPLVSGLPLLVGLGEDFHFVGHHETRVKADAELPDDVLVYTATLGLDLIHEGLV